MRRLRSTCRNGHPYTEANTRYTPEGWRRCRECARIKERRYHRERAEREGHVLGTRRDEVATYPGMKPVKVERFWELVERGPGCWLWQGSRDPNGLYGRYSAEGAHRVVYRLTKGRIPDGYDVDHLCFVPLCVNPDHLEAVTPEEKPAPSAQPDHELSARPSVQHGEHLHHEAERAAVPGLHPLRPRTEEGGGMTTPPVAFILAADYIARERAREIAAEYLARLRAETNPDG